MDYASERGGFGTHQDVIETQRTFQPLTLRGITIEIKERAPNSYSYDVYADGVCVATGLNVKTARLYRNPERVEIRHVVNGTMCTEQFEYDDLRK
jgi:predicted transcriptional regulator